MCLVRTVRVARRNGRLDRSGALRPSLLHLSSLVIGSMISTPVKQRYKKFHKSHDVL